MDGVATAGSGEERDSCAREREARDRVCTPPTDVIDGLAGGVSGCAIATRNDRDEGDAADDDKDDDASRKSPSDAVFASASQSAPQSRVYSFFSSSSRRPRSRSRIEITKRRAAASTVGTGRATISSRTRSSAVSSPPLSSWLICARAYVRYYRLYKLVSPSATTCEINSTPLDNYTGRRHARHEFPASSRRRADTAASTAASRRTTTGTTSSPAASSAASADSSHAAASGSTTTPITARSATAHASAGEKGSLGGCSRCANMGTYPRGRCCCGRDVCNLGADGHFSGVRRR